MNLWVIENVSIDSWGRMNSAIYGNDCGSFVGMALVVVRYSHRWTMYGNSSTIYFSHKRSILLKANRIIDDDLLISIKCFAVTMCRDQERDCGACMNL